MSPSNFTLEQEEYGNSYFVPRFFKRAFISFIENKNSSLLHFNVVQRHFSTKKYLPVCEALSIYFVPRKEIIHTPS